MRYNHSAFRLVLTDDVHSLTEHYRYCQKYGMPYLFCTFTLVLTVVSALSYWTLPVVPTIRPDAVYPLSIHTRLDGRWALTHGIGPVL